MTTATSSCYGIARQSPKSTPRKAVSYTFYGSAAIACLVIACGWTVYSNIFAAGIYPNVDGGSIDVAAAQRMSARVRVASAVSQSSVIVESQRAASPAADSASFDDRFATAAPSSFSFSDRFGAAAPQSVAAAPAPAQQKVASLAPPAAGRKVADAVPMPAMRPKNSGASIRDMAQRAKSAVMSVASNDKPDAPAKPPTVFEKLFGKFESAVSSPALAYASADTSSTGSLSPASTNIASVGTGALYDRQTAVYDISAHMVYLPDGTKLEAHSGLGASLDDPRSANIKMRGVTPPHLYDLKPREAMFHGVAALRLNPVGGEASIYGRAGLLAHTFMLGPNGDSNGCVSFRDYNAFLNAYRNKGVRRLAVVARL